MIHSVLQADQSLFTVGMLAKPSVTVAKNVNQGPADGAKRVAPSMMTPKAQLHMKFKTTIPGPQIIGQKDLIRPLQSSAT
jgi:hypothetical protein